jgi:hypothetical protein
MKREILNHSEIVTSPAFIEIPERVIKYITEKAGLKVMQKLAGHNLRLKITLPTQEN